MPNDSPTATQILEQRDRMLASEVFAPSKRLREFLDYLITEAISDHRPQLKELAIGIAVFGRDERFDPRVDAIVRVEAGRLRAKLREYYDEIGRNDPVRIAIPKGGYVPTFTRVEKIAGRPAGERPAWARLGLPAAVLLGVVTILGGSLVILRDRIWGDSPVEINPHAVAVLPLRDFSPRPEDYFSESMTDALIARLSEKSKLRVTSFSSVLRYKDTNIPPPLIAEQLGVGHIVAGTVFRESGRVRISAQLIDVAAGENLWSRTYERPMTNVLALQEGVAAEIAIQLAGELLPSASGPEMAMNPMAYEAYLKGRYWRNRLTAAGFNRGIRYFQEAIDLEPDYAEAYAGLASCHCQLGGLGIEVVAPYVTLPEAQRLAIKALELDASLAEPNAVLGIIKFKFEWDAEGAERYLRRAIENNPSLFEAYLWHSQVLEATGRHDLAVERARIAHRLNPLSVAANVNLGWQLHQAGLASEAEAEFDRLVEFDPDFWGGHWGRGHCYGARGRYDDAVAEFSRAVDLEGGHSLASASLGHAYAVAGQRDEALETVDRLIELSKVTYVSPMHIAMVYAGLGESDAAFEWLDKAYRVRARSMAWLTVTREFDGLRADPRYATLAAAVGIGRP